MAGQGVSKTLPAPVGRSSGGWLPQRNTGAEGRIAAALRSRAMRVPRVLIADCRLSIADCSARSFQSAISNQQSAINNQHFTEVAYMAGQGVPFDSPCSQAGSFW